MLGGTQCLWEQGRSSVARDSWIFSARIHPLMKKQAKPAGSHFFIFFFSNMLLNSRYGKKKEKFIGVQQKI